METHHRRKQFENISQLLKKGQKKSRSFTPLKATAMRGSLIGKLFRKAYHPRSIVAWRSSFVPSEILIALDIVPFAVESIMSFLAAGGIAGEILQLAEEKYSSRDTCSFLRGVNAGVIENFLPTPDFLLCTSLYCHGSAQVFYSVSKYFEKDFYYIDVPYHHNRRYAEQYVANQLREITHKMATKLGINNFEERLEEAISLSNQATEYFREINELRKHIPSPILGVEMIDYSLMLSPLFGMQEMAEIGEILAGELKERVNKKIGAVKNEKHRIIWRQLRPYYTDEIFDYLTLTHNTAVVFEEVNYIHWQYSNPQDPFRSMAQKLLSNPPLGPFERWLACSEEVVKDYHADGVIEFAQWGCRLLSCTTQMVKESLESHNVPVLVIDGDCIDSTAYFDGQVKTRIDAFIEALEAMEKA